MIILPDVRYFSAATPYHYTEDNKPLQDLAARDQTLASSIDAFSSTNLQSISAGNWSLLQATLDLTAEQGRPFAYRIRTWAIQDQSIGTSQCATYFEDLVMGYNTLAGTVTLANTQSMQNIKTGTPTLVRTVAGSGNNLIITFSGYTGTNGFVLSKAERFGV